MNITLKTTIIGDDDAVIEVSGTYYPGCAGSRDEYGAPLEPDDDEEVEILDAVDEFGNTRNLSSAEERAATEAIFEAIG